MTQKNNESYLGLGLFCAAACFLAIIVFAGLAFIAFCFTIVSILAWNRPVRLGQEYVQPEEAHAFIKGGLVGALLVPAFAILAAMFFGVRIVPGAWVYLIVGGYSAGSLGFIAWLGSQEAAARDAEVVARPVLPPSTPSPRPQPEPFRFASWDDEDARS